MSARSWKLESSGLPFLFATIALALLPASFVAWMFVSAPSFAPPGTDPGHHAYLAQHMLDTQRAFALYSQFPANGANFEYPALFDLATALVMVLTGASAFVAMESLVTVMAFVSVLCYSRFFRLFLNGSSREALVATAILALSWFVFLRTIRDGAYGELLGGGILLPLWLTFLWGERWILAPATFFVILITHNLSAAIAGAGFLAYLITAALMRNRGLIVRVTGGHVAMVLVTLVPFWSLYASYVSPVAGGTAGIFPVFGIESYPDLLSPFLLFAGIVGGIRVSTSPRSRFVTIWIVLLFVLALSSFSSERILRELSFPLAFATALLALRLEKWVRSQGLRRPETIAAAIVATVIILAAVNGLPRLAANSDPSAQYYLQPHQILAYTWLASRTGAGEAVLTIYVADPYLAPTVSASVYGIVSTNYSSTLSRSDHTLNDLLKGTLFNFSLPSSLATFRSYGFRWIVLSTPAPDPIWTLPSEVPLIRDALRLSFTSSPAYRDAGTWVSSTGYTRIVEIT